MERGQIASKSFHDGSNPQLRSYDLYQNVRVRNMRGGRKKWLPGTVVYIKGPNSYIVRVQGTKHRFIHTDHMIYDDSVPGK